MSKRDRKKMQTSEAQISINGITLTTGQAMVVRVAITSFGCRLVEDGLGDDDIGEELKQAYLDRIIEIYRLMFKKQNPDTLR